MTVEVDPIENAWQRAKQRAIRSEGCSSPSCRESNIEMLDIMHDELCQLPARIAAQMQGDQGTSLEYGKFRIRGKSAVILAVKYGIAAVMLLAVVYLIAKVHGWLPPADQPGKANVALLPHQ